MHNIEVRFEIEGLKREIEALQELLEKRDLAWKEKVKNVQAELASERVRNLILEAKLESVGLGTSATIAPPRK